MLERADQQRDDGERGEHLAVLAGEHEVRGLSAAWKGIAHCVVRGGTEQLAPWRQIVISAVRQQVNKRPGKLEDPAGAVHDAAFIEEHCALERAAGDDGR